MDEKRIWILGDCAERWESFWKWRNGQQVAPMRQVVSPARLVVHTNENMAARAA